MNKRVLQILTAAAVGAVLACAAASARAARSVPETPDDARSTEVRRAETPRTETPPAAAERERPAPPTIAVPRGRPEGGLTLPAPPSIGPTGETTARREAETRSARSAASGAASPIVIEPPSETGRATRDSVIIERSDDAVIAERPIEGITPERIIVEPRRPVPPPPFYREDVGFVVDIWTDRRVYQIDELVEIYFRVSRPSYVYIFNTDTRGMTTQIFPSFFDRDNYARPGRRYIIPDDSYQLRVDGPAGVERLWIVAVRERPVWFERQFRYSPRDPYPTYRPGAPGMIEELRRRGPVAGARPDVAPGPESIVVEPGTPLPPPPPFSRSIMPEPPGPPIPSREYAESNTSIQVVSSYRRVPVYYGELAVETRPRGARIYVDGIFRGLSPLSLRSLEPGEHDVLAELPGYRPWTGDIRIRAGRVTDLDLRLRPRGRTYDE